MAPRLDVGDVLVTRNSSLGSRLIAAGAALRDKPGLSHVAIVERWDAKGDLVCIEARPGGIGWAPAAKYLNSRYTVNNAYQPKTPEQRKGIADACEALHEHGAHYDWPAIAWDTLQAVGINLPSTWLGTWDAASVVCSSLAAYAYSQVHLDHPVKRVTSSSLCAEAYHLVGREVPKEDLRTVTPGDWADFIISHHFGVDL